MPCLQKQLIEKGGKDIVDCLSECCVDVLKCNVSLTSKQKARLAKHKRKLRIIAGKKEAMGKDYPNRSISWHSFKSNGSSFEKSIAPLK